MPPKSKSKHVKAHKFTARELWSIGAQKRREALHAPPFVEWENLYSYNKLGWQEVADYVNAKFKRITAPKKGSSHA